MCMFALTVSIVEPKNIKEAMADSAWIEAMQEELHQFDRLQVWELVDKPFLCKNLHTLGGLSGFLFSHCAHKSYQFINGRERTAFRNGPIEEGGLCMHNYTDSLFLSRPDKVYRLRKALYGLKQAPRCLVMMRTLKIPDFQRTSEHQSPRVFLINQAKYTLEILKKHGMEKGQSIGTPMDTQPKLDADLSGEPVDQTDYRSKIVDANITSRLWLQLQQNTVVLGLSVRHSNIMQPRAALTYQAYPYSGRMPTKIELTLEQSQQGVSNDVLSDTLYIHQDGIGKSFQCHHQKHCGRRPYALSWKPCQGDSLNLPDHRIHKDGDGDASFQLKSDSLPHAHAQTTKTFYKHQDSRIMKAQELKTKTSAQTLIYKIFLQRYQVYQGRLLASFQDDAKYEHVG
ncbi:integrase, catalytic region, zinc finger, CCHC-type containing protein [Tanacetum coccineum]